VGFVSGERRTHEKCGWITTLCVSSAYRKRGIARALLSRCEDQFEYEHVRLSVRRSNMMLSVYTTWLAIILYRLAEILFNGGEDALVLEKKLTF
jgi:ribosomal protein S18 acetylase RimI-like enzyme